MKIKTAIIILIIGLLLGIYFALKVTRKPGTSNPKRSSPVVLAKTDVKIQKVNNRGKLKVTTPSNNYTVEDNLSKHKIGIDVGNIPASGGTALGYSYEVMKFGEFSLNLNVNQFFPAICIYYAINENSEVGIGLGTTGMVGAAKLRI